MRKTLPASCPPTASSTAGVSTPALPALDDERFIESVETTERRHHDQPRVL